MYRWSDPLIISTARDLFRPTQTLRYTIWRDPSRAEAVEQHHGRKVTTKRKVALPDPREAYNYSFPIADTVTTRYVASIWQQAVQLVISIFQNFELPTLVKALFIFSFITFLTVFAWN